MGGGLRAGEDVTGIENIEPLVLHRPHVEIADRNDHVDIKIIFAAVDLFIPAHRLFEAGHGMGAFVEIFRFAVDP